MSRHIDFTHLLNEVRLVYDLQSASCDCIWTRHRSPSLNFSAPESNLPYTERAIVLLPSCQYLQSTSPIWKCYHAHHPHHIGKFEPLRPVFFLRFFFDSSFTSCDQTIINMSIDRSIGHSIYRHATYWTRGRTTFGGWRSRFGRSGLGFRLCKYRCRHRFVQFSFRGRLYHYIIEWRAWFAGIIQFRVVQSRGNLIYRWSKDIEVIRTYKEYSWKVCLILAELSPIGGQLSRNQTNLSCTLQRVFMKGFCLILAVVGPGGPQAKLKKKH